MIETGLQRVYNYRKHPRVSKNMLLKWFVIIDNGSMGGTHWNCFYIKYNKSYYFDRFGGQPGKLLPDQLPKPIK